MMQVIRYPQAAERLLLLQRPVTDHAGLERQVNTVLQEVKEDGDAAIRKYSLQFDKVALEELEISPASRKAAAAQVPEALKRAIAQARENIERFHAAQREVFPPVETMPGVSCWRKSVGIEKVGLYIPGGTAPLFSTVLMLGIPAVLAGCREIILCTPPGTDGNVHPALLYAAEQTGIARIFRIGGVQAIGAMAYGTASVPRVFKIFGPGNQYVTCAKQLVAREGVAIDMPAGPSEVAVFGDDSSIPAFVAADLLSQAEHGIDSQVMLVTDHEPLIAAVQEETARQLEKLPRRNIAAQALSHSRIVLMEDRSAAVALLNEYSPEHLILSCRNAAEMAAQIVNAGSVFLGHYTPESAGDYASGTNHTLPTNGYAKVYGGVSLDSFVKKITFQQITEAGIRNIGPVVETMAAAEGLDAHKNAVSVRLNLLAETDAAAGRSKE
ncbi:histidinol dehydrogenase [Compostibacter hankyongensis]|uniref:Histidinol dehydrogenase n=1 Tax=Compostibacter hankyongensis TaxID=1007089 RepID=A0ABP8FXI8_9BACT